VIGGSGFLAVYLVGLAVGSTPSRYRRQLVAFHEGIAFVAQVALFVVLGLLVFPRELPHVALPGFALAFLLMLVARPAAVWVSTAVSEFTHRDRVLLGWAGLRGAAPIVVATFVLRPVFHTERRSSTQSSSSSLSRRSCRARLSNGLHGGSVSSLLHHRSTSRRSRSGR
jgi:NhaP-type Na+/H+ and K+/H+ antiporter